MPGKFLLQLAKIMWVPLLLRMILVQIHLFDGSDSHPFNETLDESCMLGYAALTLLVSFQKLLSPQTLDVWYILLQTFITVPMLFETEENLEKTSKASLFFRLLLATLARRTWLVILANILYWVAVVHHTNFSPSCDIFQSLTLEIVLLLVTVVAVRLQQYSWTCTTLDLKSARVDLDASSTLLRSLCDTVVEVDSDLKILQKSKTSCCVPALPICNGKGGNLLSFFSPEDQSHIESTLRKSEGLSSSALALNARMLDSFGSPFDVELLHVPYTNIAGKSCRLIGIRDFRGSEFVEVAQAPPSTAVQSAAEALEGIVTKEDMSLLFDASSFELLSASDEFLEFLEQSGRSDTNVQNKTLMDLFPDTRPTSLLGRIQDAVNSAAHGPVEDFCCYNVELGDDTVHVMVSLEHDSVLEQLVGTLSISASSSVSPLTESNLARLPSNATGCDAALRLPAPAPDQQHDTQVQQPCGDHCRAGCTGHRLNRNSALAYLAARGEYPRTATQI